MCERAFKFFIIAVDVVWMMHARKIACAFDHTEKLLAALMISADEIHLHRFSLVCASFVSTYSASLCYVSYICMLSVCCVYTLQMELDGNQPFSIYSIWSTNRINVGGGSLKSNNTFTVGRLLNEIVH